MAADPPAASPVLVAPALANERNTIREGLVPVAGWQLDDIRFNFDSSFLLPDAREEFAQLATLRAQHPTCRLSLFGHADPVGEDEYNKLLSGRRATATYAVLTRRTDLWEMLYSHAHGRDKWGESVFSVMHTAVSPTDASHQIPASPGERAGLFAAYMEYLCRDHQGQAFTVEPGSGFLAAGADEQGKGDYQGCGEFNPMRVMSAGEWAGSAHDKQARDEANAPNRRVVGVLFRTNSIAYPSTWPCPRALDGVSGCRRRFWSDSADRRHMGPDVRTSAAQGNTFACRFYDRLSLALHGRLGEPVFAVRLYDTTGRFMPHAAYRLLLPDRDPTEGHADSRGFVQFRAPASVTEATLKWGASGTADAPRFRFRQEVRLDAGGDGSEEAAARLANLGYGWDGPLKDRVRAFQTDYGSRFGISPTGDLDPKTEAAIQAVHDGTEDQIR